MKWSGKRIVKLDLYKEVSTVVFGKIGYEHLLFIVLHCICLYFCYQTIGEQHAEALARAEERNIDILDESEKLRSSALNFLSGKDAEENAAQQEFLIPSKWLPGFWPSIALGLSFILHALMVLGQQWSIGFRCLIRFRREDNPNLATHARILPGAHLGKEELVPIQRSDACMYFEFHRRKYVFDSSLQSFIKVRCRVNHPIEHYITWDGIPDDAVCRQLKELYGPNKFQMASPTFMDLYVTQITSPFTVFQLFCVLLWCMDSYWQYSLFTLFMICSFEATTVFSRLKSLQTLKGMGNEAHNIHAYRANRWVTISTEELLPGDLFSLTKHSNDIIPCDALIIRGAAVVNEATLTGESVPQMKEGIANSSYEDLNEQVNIKGVHKTHALFGGTRVLQVTSVRTKQEECEEDARDEIDMRLHEDATGGSVTLPAPSLHDEDESSIPPPPDDGCLCYCTRTGFSSSQGKLVRMIENSTAAVRGDTRDTVYLLLILLVFALSASGYVLYMGMQDGSKSKYQLLLHCILIVTSVIPPELPMQTALAVNSSLMTLMKMQVFCTEPFRVPIAGKVDTCIFDKTGTLTTDELVAVGVVSPSIRVHDLRREHAKAMEKIEEQARLAAQKAPAAPGAPKAKNTKNASEVVSTISAATAGMTPVRDANAECTLVLGGCHSLVLVDGKVAGDPLEVASLKAIRWELSPATGASRPKPETMADHPMKIKTLDAGDIPVSQMTILSRHHFSSKLQRMSVVSRMKGDAGAFVLVKGSPEAIARMCSDCPADYVDVAGDLAKRGMRVIALAMKRVTGSDIQAACDSRSLAESSLRFVGFASFTCRVRKDTPAVVQQLRDGGMTVCMATGDAMLTAVHVAIEVGITTRGKKGVLILERQEEKFVWVDYESGSEAKEAFSVSGIATVEKSYDLCVAGPVLSALMDTHPEVSTSLDKFVVFARMRPDEKERVLLAMRSSGRVCLMCGDGANDVGALKQAHVGVALLSGFGDLNVARENNSADPSKPKASTEQVSAFITQSEYDDLMKLKISDLKARLRQIGVEPDDYPQCVEKKDLVDLFRKHSSKKAQENHDLKRQKELMKMSPEERKKALAKERQEMMQKKQDEFKREYDAMVARGESWAMFKAMQKIWAADMEEAKKKKKQDNSLTGSAGRMAAMMDQMEGMEDMELPMVKIGDASVASPFTSKMPSIRGAVDIIRQGRCTLVTTIQMYQILALNCLISAYSLSVLHLDGVKYGDRQMTCLGMLMSVSFVTISRSKPLDKLSPVRPLKSVFHPALILSLFGQFALHLGTMYYLVQYGKSFLPEDYKVDMDKEFSPNIVNSVVFLVTAVQQVSVFVVNLKGPPFMGGLVENTPLLWSLAVTFVGTFMCASESIPQLNVWLQLQPFPTIAFRNIVLLALAIDVCGSFLWDRLLLGIFAYPVLSASLKSTTQKDIIAMVKTFAIVIALVSWIASQDYSELIEEMEKMEAENRVNSESLASSI